MWKVLETGVVLKVLEMRTGLKLRSFSKKKGKERKIGVTGGKLSWKRNFYFIF